MGPTTVTYTELRRAYDALNAGLFGGVLPACLLTLQRERRTYGYFSAGRFGNSLSGHVDENTRSGWTNFRGSTRLPRRSRNGQKSTALISD